MGLFKPPPGLTETESYGFSPACFSFAGGQIAKGFGSEPRAWEEQGGPPPAQARPLGRRLLLLASDCPPR